MKALCLQAIGFGSWGQMEKKPRAPVPVMAHLVALTGAMKNRVVPAPPPLLPEAVAGTEVMIGVETETEIGTGTETETGIETGTETETGIGIETGSGREIGSGIEIEKVPSAGQTHSLNAGPLGKGTLCMCTERT